MTTPASPTPRSIPTRRPSPRSADLDALFWFAEHGVTVERVLSDNGSAYKSFAWRDACARLGIAHKRTRPYRPQTNGKIERFHRTLADSWAYARFYSVQRPSGATSCRAGCASTVLTGTTPRSAVHPSADSTTCLDTTPRSSSRSRINASFRVILTPVEEVP